MSSSRLAHLLNENGVAEHQHTLVSLVLEKLISSSNGLRVENRPELTDIGIALDDVHVEGGFEYVAVVFRNCGLTTLRGLPSKLISNLTIENCNISSLDDCTNEILNDLRLTNCAALTSLRGCATRVRFMKVVACNSLKSLIGIERTSIETRLYLQSCGLSSIDALPISAEGIHLHKLPFLRSLSGVNKLGLTLTEDGVFSIQDCGNLTHGLLSVLSIPGIRAFDWKNEPNVSSAMQEAIESHDAVRRRIMAAQKGLMSIGREDLATM